MRVHMILLVDDMDRGVSKTAILHHLAILRRKCNCSDIFSIYFGYCVTDQPTACTIVVFCAVVVAVHQQACFRFK